MEADDVGHSGVRGGRITSGLVAGEAAAKTGGGMPGSNATGSVISAGAWGTTDGSAAGNAGAGSGSVERERERERDYLFFLIHYYIGTMGKWNNRI